MGSRQFLDPIRIVSVTTTQRDALSGVGNGDLIYNSTLAAHQMRMNGAWVTIGDYLTGAGFTPVKLSSIIAVGHSYLGGTNNASTGTSLFDQNGMLAHLAGMLGVHSDNIQDGAQSGTALGLATNITSAAVWAGWAYALEFMVPPTSALLANTTLVTTNARSATSTPGLVVIVHGYNDLNYATGSTAINFTYNLASWSNVLRTVISRARAGALYSSSLSTAGAVTWDGTIAFSGGTTTAQVAANTGPAIRVHTTNGNTDTFTIPTNVPASFVVAMCYIGTGACLLSPTGSMNNTDVTTVVTVGATLGASTVTGDVLYDINDANNPPELVQVTAGGGTTSQTLTRGFNSTTKRAHNANTLFVKNPAGQVNFTGTAAPATGSLVTEAVGLGGNVMPVVKRFACTSADAGKTIIGTTAGFLTGASNSKLSLDSVWIEAVDPPMVVVANMPRFNYANVLFNDANVTSLNSNTASVVAEFDGAVQVADFDTPVFNRGGVLANTALNNTTSGTITGIAVTANSTDFQNTTGWVMTAASEDMLVTAISGTYPNYTVSVTRGYNSTTIIAHANAATVSDASWFHTDRLHPNIYGHGVFAQQLYSAVAAMSSLSTYQIAHSAGNVTQDAQRPVLGIRDNYYMEFNLNATPVYTTTWTLNQLWYFPFYIPQWCLLTGIALRTGTTATGTATNVRTGIYDVDATRAFPGALIQEFGTAATTALNTTVEPAAHKLLAPGWYFAAYVNQGTTAGRVVTIGVGAITPNYPYHMVAAVPTATANNNSLPFFLDSGSITGSLPATAAAAENGGPVPLPWIHLRTKHYA